MVEVGQPITLGHILVVQAALEAVVLVVQLQELRGLRTQVAVVVAVLG